MEPRVIAAGRATRIVQLAQHVGQWTAVDVLHDVIMDTGIEAGSENRDDVLVVKKAG